MTFPHKLTGSYGEALVGRATADDLQSILALFDEAVVWLASRGREGQWGTTPFSDMPGSYHRFMQWIDSDALFVVRIGGNIVGTVALSETLPQYATGLFDSFPITAYYLEAFTTSRSLAGRGLGRDLLRWAEEYAREQGKTTIYLDCWAEHPDLPGYYEQAGYLPRTEFNVGEWRGLLFEKELQ